MPEDSFKRKCGSSQLNKEGKRMYVKVAKSTVRTNNLSMIIMKKAKEICASFAVSPQTAKVFNNAW